MEYRVEDVTPVKKRVEVDIPVELVNGALAASLAIARQKVEIKGFRKGKVPTDMIRARFGKELVKEATDDLVNANINEIMNELKTFPLSGIAVDAGMLEEGQPFTYSFSFEVAPKLDLPDYKGRDAEQEEAVVDPAEVEAVLNRIRDNLAEFKPIMEARKPVDGELVTVSFAGTELGVPVEGVKADNFELTLGQGHSLEAFEDLVKSTTVGETASGQMTFPADFLNKDLAGRTIDMQVSLHAVKEKQLPEIDDAMAKKAGGFESLEKMREAIEKSYMESRLQLTRAMAQKKLLDSMLEGMDIPLPDSMVEGHVDRMVNELRGRLERQGRSLESIGKTETQLQAEFLKDAEELTRSQLFLLAVAEKEALTVDQRELDQYYAGIAKKTGQDLQTVKRFHEDSGMAFNIRDKLLADKAMDVIWSSAKVTMVPPKKEQTTEDAAEKAE